MIFGKEGVAPQEEVELSSVIMSRLAPSNFCVIRFSLDGSLLDGVKMTACEGHLRGNSSPKCGLTYVGPLCNLFLNK